MGIGIGDAFVLFIPLLIFFFCIATIIFVIRYLMKFLKVQQEKNELLRTIVDKIDKLKD
ncbi:hypothetical protein ACWV26_06795 [Rummeliibacillus sp. JY-2-4R]